VRVPGAIDTPMPVGAFENIPEAAREAAKAAAVSCALMKRLGRSCAAVAVLLASSNTSYMTRSVVAIDGGWTAVQLG